MTDRQPQLTAEDLRGMLPEWLPEASNLRLEAVGPMTATARAIVGKDQLRPGGTVSGPTQFGLADFAFYAAVLAMIGREPMTVTTNLSLDFMRAPAPKDLIAEARILKLGRRLAFGDVIMHSDGDPTPVSRASVTYAIPSSTPSPRR
ncbi:MAG: PaaI family thioesterase [Pseudomonadota bacterium]